MSIIYLETPVFLILEVSFYPVLRVYLKITCIYLITPYDITAVRVMTERTYMKAYYDEVFSPRPYYKK